MTDLCFVGKVVAGCGKAHLPENLQQHDRFFNCRMVGTLNVKLESPFRSGRVPAARGDEKNHYWFVHIRNKSHGAYAWAYRWEGSRMGSHILELVSRQPLPQSFLSGPVEVSFPSLWDAATREAWVAEQYWFQSFDWSPRKADSGLVRDIIRPACSWSNRTVLDVGAHYGYHSFWASAEGASVVGFEPEAPSRSNAITIDQHIEQEGILFVDRDPGGSFDVILYLSVHHQIDPAYDRLEETVAGYAARCQDLFVEIILPSSIRQFGGKRTDLEVDRLIGGEVLHTYPHRTRGRRRIYHVRNPQ